MKKIETNSSISFENKSNKIEREGFSKNVEQDQS